MVRPHRHRGKRRRALSAGKRAVLATVATLLLHGAFVGVLVLLSLFPDPPRRPVAPKAVSLRPLSPEAWEKNFGRESSASSETAKRTEPKKDKPKEPTPKTEKRPKGQVVDLAPGNNEESEDAKYLAERANRVQKETRAREQSADYRNAMPQTTRQAPSETKGQDSADRLEIAGNNGTGEDERSAGGGKNELHVPKVSRQDSLALRVDPRTGAGAQVQNREAREESPGNSDRLQLPSEPGDSGAAGKLGRPGARNLVPSMAVLDKISGAAPNDHLRDVEEGDGTFLNAKEWKYASFFNRVKQSVGMHWNPGPQLMGRDPTGNIYGARDRYTVVQVALTPRGTVKEIFVEKSCGLDFLDLEAVKSFERAQPFPNPPAGLADSDQLVRFSFGFFVEMGSGTGLRIFRQAN